MRVSKMLFRLLSLTFLILSLSPSAVTVLVERPVDSFVGSTDVQEFVFVASGAYPLSCELVLDGAVADVKKVSDANESLFAVVLPQGLHEWAIKCVDAVGERDESSARRIILSAQESVPLVSSEFSILSGAVVSGASSQGGFLRNWKTVKGESVSFSSSVSNKGVSVVTAFLTVKIKTAGEELVEAIESMKYSLGPGESKTLKASWTPSDAGTYYVEGTVGDGSSELQRSFLKLSVVERIEEGGVFAALLVLCLAVTAFASLGVRKNLKEISVK